MDQVAYQIEQLKAIDPAEPKVVRSEIEAALLEHCRLIGFEQPAVHWVESPVDANAKLAGVNWEMPHVRKWYLANQASYKAAWQEIRGRGKEVWREFCRTQARAEKRIDGLLEGVVPQWIPMTGIDGQLADVVHGLPFMLRAALRDMSIVDSSGSPKFAAFNRLWLPFFEAYRSGLGAFWTIDEDFVCLPMPSMKLRSGRLHADKEPALVWPDGRSFWYQDGELETRDN